MRSKTRRREEYAVVVETIGGHKESAKRKRKLRRQKMKSMHLIKHHFINKRDRLQVWLQAFPISALDGVEWPGHTPIALPLQRKK